MARRQSSNENARYEIPETYLNLDENTAPEPAVRDTHLRQSLETARTSDSHTRDQEHSTTEQAAPPPARTQSARASREESRARVGESTAARLSASHRQTRITSARPDSEAYPRSHLNEGVTSTSTGTESSVLAPLSAEPLFNDVRRSVPRERTYSHWPAAGGAIARDEEKTEVRDSSVWNSPRDKQVTKWLTQLYTVSYLILFAILGTLARLGLQALTSYPGAVVTQGVVWANVGGSFVLGFLVEDRNLFAEEWGRVRPQNTSQQQRQSQTYNPVQTQEQRRSNRLRRLSWWRRDRELTKNSMPYHRTTQRERPFASAHAASLFPQRQYEAPPQGPRASDSQPPPSLLYTASPTPSAAEDEKKRHAAAKKTIPLYVGLSVGFCGSFTSFSSFQRDVFLALSNAAPSTELPGRIAADRSGGFSFLAFLATWIVTPALSLAALQVGAHLALGLAPWTPAIPFWFSRRVLDRAAVPLAWLVWIGAIIMTAVPPDRPGGPAASATTVTSTDLTSGTTTVTAVWFPERWRGDVLFALVFAPLGCLVRFYASLALNARIPSFPLGTFAVNIGGTVLEAVFYGLQHRPAAVGGGRLACQALMGLMDGFCGCLTTVSTWVAELDGLRRAHAYVYGAASLGAGLAAVLVAMGPVRWTGGGFEATACGVH